MGRGRRRQKARIAKNVVITDMATGGKGVGHEESGKAIMVDYAIPGDVVDAYLYKNKKAYGIGNIQELLEPSPLRIDAFCSHFGECGGCRWQHVAYQQQLLFKQKIVNDAFERIAKIDAPTIQPIIAAPDTKHYRNKLEYTFSNNRWLSKEQIASGAAYDKSRALGFHVPRYFDKIVDIDTCHLQDDLTNSIKNKLREFAIEKDLSFYNLYKNEGFLRNLIIRNSTLGQWMVTVAFGQNLEQEVKDVMAFLAATFPEVTSLNYVINTKGNDTILDLEIVNYAGQPHIKEQIGDAQFIISPKSFFQTNSKQCKVLYDKIIELAELNCNDIVYDLFTGTGSIANYVAKSCKKVIGVEIVAQAIEDAKENAALNNNLNTVFAAGKVEDLFTDKLLELHGKPDVVIVDPPRAGMHEKVIKQLLALACKKIVYVSCNPATQARDIALLSETYKVDYLQPIDLFPHTFHVENIASLTIK